MRGTFRLILFTGTLTALACAYQGPISTLELRLETPLNSYNTPVKSAFESVLIAPCLIGDRVLLPAGTRVYGTVKHRTQVGIGIRHERAGLELSFDEYQMADGRKFPMTGRLELIENARETVDEHGRLHGVIAANNPQHWLDGLWNRPSATLVQRSLLGLTGMSGRFFNWFEMGPVGGAALIAFRITVFSLPEPEIQLPPGTEMKVLLTSLPQGSPAVAPAPPAEVPEPLAQWIREQPFAIFRSNGRSSDDKVNLAFTGTREQLIQAFHAAGWTEAAPRTMRSFSRFWRSYASQTGYADAPASRLWYLGAEPDLILQKSFNTVARRHHVRIWQTDSVGPEVWLGAATHDVAIRFDTGSKNFAHKIDPRIDFERSKITNDLAFAGCAGAAGYVERPQAVRDSSDGKAVVTDGRLAVIPLHDCAVPSTQPETVLTPKPARSIFIRSIRRVVLETREYFFRENPYYWAFWILQWNHARTRDTGITEY